MRIRLQITLMVLFGLFMGTTIRAAEISSVKTIVKGNCIEIQFISPQIIRVLKYVDGTLLQKESLSVIKAARKIEVKINDQLNFKELSTASLKIIVDKQTGQVSFQNLKKELLLKEGLTYDLGNTVKGVKQSFILSDSEAIYGLGQHQKGTMNQRNQKLYLKQSNMEIAIPFFQSTNGYGLYWDNYSATFFHDNAGSTSFDSEHGECIDYYFIKGDEADQVIAGYRELTGQAPMFPRWTFGYWQSKERYKSQDELLGVVKKFRDLKVPLDGIIQDWQYWGVDNKNWNSTAFENPLFPDPKSMVDSIHKLNAHLIISVWPSFGSKSKIFQELKSKNMLYNFLTYPVGEDIKVYDAFNPAARDIYWKHLNKNLFSIGVDGWWLDATEPVMKKLTPRSETTKHENEVSDAKTNPEGIATYLGDFAKYGNAYPLASTSGIYDNQRKANPHKRVFILTRSAFAGQQRNATMLWSGDIRASWPVFKNQIAAGVNLSLSGIPYWNADIGGFFTSPNYPLGVKDPAYQELYVRWLQFAAFTPMFRSHGTQTPREIYQFGKKGEPAYDAIEKYINLRYRLLPYIYSNAWSITAQSSTMMRGLVMDFKNDPKVLDINDQYLFGKSILVAPITDSLIRSKKVYLPKGAVWFDFWTGEQHNGGQTVKKDINLAIMPLYVKGGSIIPMGPEQQYVGEKDDRTLEMRIYKGANGTFKLYEDESDGYAYENGKYTEIDFNWNNQKNTLTIEKRKGAFPGMLKSRTFNLILVDRNQGIGANSEVNVGKPVAYNGTEKVIKF